MVARARSCHSALLEAGPEGPQPLPLVAVAEAPRLANWPGRSSLIGQLLVDLAGLVEAPIVIELVCAHHRFPIEERFGL